MNNTVLNSTDIIDSTVAPCPNCVCPSIYSELGVFISSILLSLGGIVSILLVGCRKSNCSEISCCGLKLKRSNLHVGD